jgi:hypothetical protein
MTRSTLVAVAPLVVALLGADMDPKLKGAQEQAQACGDATVKGDYARMAVFTHPKLIAILGGRQKTIEATRKAREKLKESGVAYLSAKTEAPDALHRAGNVLYCLVPMTYGMKNTETRFRLKSPLIGVSFDDGKTWTFLDTAPGEEKVRKLVPEIPKTLKFPPEAAPEPN